MRPAISFGLALIAVLSPSPALTASSALDPLAHEYVMLVAQAAGVEPELFGVGSDLGAIEREAKAHPLQRQVIVGKLDQLVAQLDRLKPSDDPLLAMRQRNLRAFRWHCNCNPRRWPLCRWPNVYDGYTASSQSSDRSAASMLLSTD